MLPKEVGSDCRQLLARSGHEWSRSPSTPLARGSIGVGDHCSHRSYRRCDLDDGRALLGSLLILLAVGVVVLGLAALGSVIALGLPRPTPFAERNLLTARLAWMGRTVWAAALIAVGGFFGAIIATDLSSPALNSVGRIGGYLVTTVLVIVVLASYGVVLPIAVVMGIDLVRASRGARGDALRNATGDRALNATWVDHLSRTQYAWAALVALALTVPLLVAVLFWMVVMLGLWTWPIA